MIATIDEDLHRSLATILSSLGFEVLDIRDHGLRGKPDDAIFAFAQKHKAILFSGDLGFSNILRFPPGKHQGIVILRFPNEISTARINKEVKGLLLKIPKADYKSNLIIVSPGNIRIRKYKKLK